MFETFSTNAIQIIDDALQIARSLNKKLVGSAVSYTHLTLPTILRV